MQATMRKNGHVVLAKSVRNAAKIRIGDKVEVKSTAPGKVILRRVDRRTSRQQKTPLLNVKPFPRRTLEKVYREAETDWDFTVSSAIAAQHVRKFEE
jgi:bifunctional DNA-binding transcriptional regulator/antitoxin component of YhaV-PrlF toxin-antitoxin module